MSDIKNITGFNFADIDIDEDLVDVMEFNEAMEELKREINSLR